MRGDSARDSDRSIVHVLAAHAGLGLLAVARTCAPRLRGLVRAADRCGRRGLARAVRHRATLAAVALRSLWWASLVCGVRGGLSLVDIREPIITAELPFPFLRGLGLCAVVVVLAQARHLRWAATLLGAAHAAAAALVYALIG